LEHGDLLLLYTDGITEAMARPDPTGHRELFGVERLDSLLRACRDCHPEECIERIRDAVREFTGGSPATDDQTLIAVRCRHL
jgi:sigma-B regulation protein RsbU (phosphoserine phosphatase)